MLQPAAVHLGEARGAEHFGATSEEPLRLRMDRALRGLQAVLEVPPKLADRHGVERGLQLLADDGLIRIVDAVERARTHEP